MQARIDVPGQVPDRSARGRQMTRMRRIKLERQVAQVLVAMVDHKKVSGKLKLPETQKEAEDG